MNVLRRIRGLVVTAVVWAIGWMLGGLLVDAVVFWFQIGPPFFVPLVFLRLASPLLRTLAMAGALAGAGFATLLLVAERRRRLSQFTARRAALWGALGGVVVVLGTVVVWDLALGHGAELLTTYALRTLGLLGLISGSAGALMAGTHVGLARRGLPAEEESGALPGPDPGA